MKEIRVQQTAALHIDEIYRYTSQRWGEEKWSAKFGQSVKVVFKHWEAV